MRPYTVVCASERGTIIAVFEGWGSRFSGNAQIQATHTLARVWECSLHLHEIEATKSPQIGDMFGDAMRYVNGEETRGPGTLIPNPHTEGMEDDEDGAQ